MATNLQFIKEVNITSASANIQFDNFFNSAEYDKYCIIYSGFYKTVVSDSSLRLIDNSGSTISDTEYEFATINLRIELRFMSFLSNSKYSIPRCRLL